MCCLCQGYWDISWDTSNIMSSTNSEVLWWGRMTSLTTTHSSLSNRNQWTSHRSLGPARLLFPSLPPPPNSSAEVCNFTLQRQTAGQKENVWPTLAFVLISLSNVQTLLPLGYLKWCGEDSQPLLSSPCQTHHQNKTSSGDRAEVQDTARQRGRKRWKWSRCLRGCWFVVW